MKKEVLIGLCLIAFIGGIVYVAGAHQLSDTIPKNTKDAPFSDPLQSTSCDILGSGQSTSRIVLNTTIMKSQSHVKLYKTLPKVITKSDVIVFAKKFNMSDFNEPNEGDTVISVSSKDMRYRAILSKNGGKEFEDSFRSHKPNGIDIFIKFTV